MRKALLQRRQCEMCRVTTTWRPLAAGARQSAKVTLPHMDVQMLRAQDAQEQPFAGGRRSDV
jgi:hypothetical protein